MTKICLLSNRNIYMQRICNLLVENNFEVHLICRSKGGLSQELFNKKIIFHQLSSNSLFRKFFEINKIIKKIKPDFFHVQGVFKDAFIPALKLFRKYKYYITIWGSDLNFFSKKLINKILQNIALIACDNIHLLSDQFQRQVIDTYHFINPQKIKVFSWGIDYSFFQNPNKKIMQNLMNEFGIKTTDILIVSYRNHKDIYNHHTTIKSMQSVINKFPSVKFIFTKGSSDEKCIKQTFELVHQNHLENHFIFINRWLSDKELCALINMSKICISIPIADGFPSTILETMASSTIPIISDLENYHPFFKDGLNGFYLKKIDDNNELSEIIIKILNTYDDIAKSIFTRNNQFIKELYDLNIQSRKQINMYRK